ncbi:unnamed protein product [Orchesella dallaii]|uniref:Uncharacterized protein n=1 Tax=Orchesella dallaii TaxID=48710 RepID=A0ABP1RMW9_9HEXA
MQEGNAFVQEMQRQHDALTLQMQWQHEVLIQQVHERDALNKEVQERELLHYKIIAGQAMKITNLEHQVNVQINESDKKCAESEKNLEAMETANKSMKKELHECKEICEELKGKLEQKSTHDNLQEGIVNSTQVQQQQVKTGPGPALMGEEDETLYPLSSSNGYKLSSISESESAELKDFETMQHFRNSGKSGPEGGNPTHASQLQSSVLGNEDKSSDTPD